VDMLFLSVAEVGGAAASAALLTGMAPMAHRVCRLR
jgi:hypothetical protein